MYLFRKDLSIKRFKFVIITPQFKKEKFEQFIVIQNSSTRIMNKLHLSSCTIQHSCLYLLNDCGLKCLIYQVLKVQYNDDLSATHRRTKNKQKLKNNFWNRQRYKIWKLHILFIILATWNRLINCEKNLEL